MRGRAAEIADAGALDWEVVWEALKTEPPAENPSTITQELGLGDEDEIIQTNAGVLATGFAGTPWAACGVAHGRGPVHGACAWLQRSPCRRAGGAVPHPRERPSPGRGAGSASGGRGRARGVAPGRGAWRDVEIDGGPDGTIARRPVKADPQGYSMTSGSWSSSPTGSAPSLVPAPRDIEAQCR